MLTWKAALLSPHAPESVAVYCALPWRFPELLCRSLLN
jgi:hypothetical protein